MKRKFVFLIFILMLDLFIIPNLKPKAAAYTGGYTVNVYFGTGYLANEGIDFYNNSAIISSLNPYSNYEMKTIQALGWTNHSISNVTKLKLRGGDDMYSVSVDGTTEEFSWGTSYEYELTSDINLYLNVSEKSNNNTIETIGSGYSLTYVIDGIEETVSSLTTVPTLSTPTKEGFLFDGWYYEETFETKVNEGDTLTSDTTIYAKFNELYDINFVVKHNGVELRQLDSITNVTEIPGNLPNPDEDDYLTFYVFEGWFFDEAFTSGVVGGIELSRDVTLYAKLDWLRYTLTFDTNTDLITLDPVEITGETMMSIGTLPVLSHDDFDFLGWYYEESFETQVQETDCLTTDTTIYAKLGNYKYVLSFVTGLEEYDSYYIESINSSFVTFPYWSYETFECLGWYYDDERTIKATEGDLLTSDTILYAKISQKKYILSFDSKGGNEIQSMTCANIFLEEDQPVPTKQGYTFVGWYYDNYSYNEPVVYNDTLTSDITLYANYTKNEYILSFDTDGSPVQTIRTGYISNPLPISVKSGYTFIGWYYDEDYTQEVFPQDEVNQDTTIYAKFNLSYNGVIEDVTNNDGNISLETVEYILIFLFIGFIVIKIIKKI